MISQSGWKTSEELLNHIISIIIYSSLIFGGRGSSPLHPINAQLSSCQVNVVATTFIKNLQNALQSNQSWIYENSYEIVHPSFSFFHQIKFCINLTKLLLTQDKISKNKNSEVYCIHILLIYSFDVFNMPVSWYEFHQI